MTKTAPETIRGEKLLLRLLDGFLESKALMTAFKLGVFTLLSNESLSMADALRRLELPERSGRILLEACLALGLLEETGGRLRTPDDLTPFLTSGSEQPFRPTTYMIDYYDHVYRAMVDMDRLVRSDGAESSFTLRDYFKDDVNDVPPAVAAEYSRYMDATMGKIVEVVLDTGTFAGDRYLLDLCGGTGTFCTSVVRNTPGLRGGFLDVPACVDIGRKRLAQDAELASRVDAYAGDAFTTELPGGPDVVTICRAAHDWDDTRIGRLFQRIHDRLPSGGRLVIIERMLPDGFDPGARSLYVRALYFLAKSQHTRYRSVAEYTQLLRGAGFTGLERVTPSKRPYEFFQGLVILSATRA